MKEKEEVKDGSKSVIILLVIIIIGLIFAIGYLLGARQKDKTLLEDNIPTKETSSNNNTNEEKTPVDEGKTEEKSEEKTEEKPEEKTEEQGTNKYDKEELTKEAKSLIPYELCGAPDMPLNKKTVTINELSDDLKGKMVISKLGFLKADETVTIVPDDYTKYFKDISFLTKLKNNKDAQYSLGATILLYKNGKYVAETYATGCEGAYEGEVLRFLSSSIENDTLKLSYANYWIAYDYENDYYTISKEKNGKATYDNVKYEYEKDVYTVNGKEISYDVFAKYVMEFNLEDNNIRFEKMVYNAK